MKKLYIRRASELVTCRGSAPKKGAEMADIGLIKNGGVLIHDDRIFAVGKMCIRDRTRMDAPENRSTSSETP